MVAIDEMKLRRRASFLRMGCNRLRPRASSSKGFMAEKHTGCRSLPEASP